MLKRHQAVIDLAKNALIIEGHQIRFLDEHELPKNSAEEFEVDEQVWASLFGSSRPIADTLLILRHGNPVLSSGAKLPVTAPGPNAVPTSKPADAGKISFPGAGHSLTPSAPSPSSAGPSTASPSAPTASYSASDHATIVGLGGQSFSCACTNTQRLIVARSWSPASPEQATQLLESTNGNVEMAAALLFSNV